MGPRLTRFIGVCLIVLGVTPVTAPFSTDDLRVLIHHQHSHEHADGPAGGAIVKAATASDEAPVLAVTAAPTSPLFKLIFHAPVVARLRVSSPRTSRQVLRI